MLLLAMSVLLAAFASDLSNALWGAERRSGRSFSAAVVAVENQGKILLISYRLPSYLHPLSPSPRLVGDGAC